MLARKLSRLAHALSLMPKAKIVFAFSQSVTVLPSVYNVKLPPRYYEWTSFLDVFVIDWSQFAVPGYAASED